jgi:hypothetical protein
MIINNCWYCLLHPICFFPRLYVALTKVRPSQSSSENLRNLRPKIIISQRDIMLRRTKDFNV